MAWERKRYKNGKIYVEVDDQGRMVVQNGLVRYVYKTEDTTRVYTTKASAVRNLDGAIPARTDDDPVAGSSGPGARVSRKRMPKTAGPLKTSTLNNASPIADLQSPGQDYIEIFTDGACSGNPGPSGLGVVLRWGPYHRELRQYLGSGTNNTAELTAIKVALEAVHDPKRLPVRIFTDSKYAIGVLTGRYTARANRELIGEIRGIMRRFPNLQLLKVAGHSGHPLNERADELARQSIDEAAKDAAS